LTLLTRLGTFDRVNSTAGVPVIVRRKGRVVKLVASQMSTATQKDSSSRARAERSNTQRSGLSEGVFLAATTAIAYVVAFQYEAGHAAVYGFPETLIDVQLTQIFVAFASLTIVIVLFHYVDLHVGLVPRDDDGPVHRAFSKAMFWAFIGAVLLTIGASSFSLWLVVGTLAFALLVDVIIPLLRFSHLRGYRRRLEADQRQEDTLFRRRVLLGLGARERLGVLSAIVAVTVSFHMGQVHAKKSTAVLRNRYRSSNCDPASLWWSGCKRRAPVARAQDSPRVSSRKSFRGENRPSRGTCSWSTDH
jgi:hypothetical protein